MVVTNLRLYFYLIFQLLLLACEQALLFGRVKRVSRERASERRSRDGQRRAPRSRVLARLISLAQIGELARRLFLPPEDISCDE